MCKTCFVDGLLVETEKICSAYFVGGKDEIEAEKNAVFVGGDSRCLSLFLLIRIFASDSELDEELMLESEVSELEVANVVT
ncbi:hypothetical protein F8M41_004644 [Gigaspora margarita]|uniref:Uncharacterized protein n=1 Tax=Gigaspora margarita TaxID=4874 RepID=A0A8H3XA66_GIGMA|nr:hypothetical protein F8M41_004644 [Gigaspora margarita]